MEATNNIIFLTKVSPDTQMIKVKVTHPYGNWPLARQTPNNSRVWGNCEFFINDKTKECNYWFVFDDLLQEESVICDPQNIIIITLECPAIRPSINLRFLRQFGTILTYSRQINHPKVIDIISPSPWHIGINNTNNITITRHYKIYNDFKTLCIPDKPKLISVISSNKRYVEGHIKRLKFVEVLKEYFKENIDVFGRGINDFADKWDVILPYKYHISLENSSCNNGITEKLYDSFLGGAYPFYYGCPNVHDYFPNQSFTSIDINDFDKSIKMIESSISNQVYERAIQFIQESKNSVLDKYNIFNIMADYCVNNLVFKQISKVRALTLKPESYFTNIKIDNIKRFFKKLV